MTLPECPQESLIEALRDGRLGPRERASIERHVGVCAICRDLAGDLEQIGEAVRAPRDPATPLEHQRARQGLLLRASEVPAVPAPRHPLSFVFAAAILAMAIGVGWFGARATGSDHALYALRFDVPRPVAAVHETAIRPSDDARFERAKSAGLDVITLTSGALDVTLVPLAAGERFVVRTTDAEVEVHGTAFHIDAELGRIRAVSVAEGAVEVRYAGFLAVIPSGGSWRATGDSVSPIPPPPANTKIATVAARTSDASIPQRAHLAHLAQRTQLAQRPQRTERYASPVVVEEKESPAPSAAPSAIASTPPTSSVSREFAEAMNALGQGDYDVGAARLKAFAIEHPNEPRADEADYLRAIALQRAGHPDDARASAKRYLATRPGGAHRVEAIRIAGD